MIKVSMTVTLALMAGVLAFFLMRSHKMSAHDGVLLDSMPELKWMKNDLKLTDDQFAKVSELHLAYRPVCVDLCARISAAHEKVESLAQVSRGMTPELETALREHATTHAECQQAMLEHIYRTAALLEPEQSTRYVESVLPTALGLTQSCSSHQE